MQGIETLITNLLVQRIERWPPEPEVGGSSLSWRTRLNFNKNIGEALNS